MCRYKDGEAMVRVRKETRERLRDLMLYFRRAVDTTGRVWWKRDDGPSADDVVNRLLDFFEAWRTRRKASDARRRVKTAVKMPKEPRKV